MGDAWPTLKRLCGSIIVLGAFLHPPVSPSKGAGRAWELDPYRYRVPLAVAAAGYGRWDRPVESEIDFSKLLAQHGRNDYVDPAHLILLEVTESGTRPVPFQFDRDEDFHPWTDARGTLTFVLTGETPPDAERRFHMYFGLRGFAERSRVPVPRHPVSVEFVPDHEGQAGFCIRAANATYYYHKLGAGFASLEDEDGNDWLSYNPGVGLDSNSGSGGKYRGTPNMGYPEGYCHPGEAVSDSRIVASGPIKVTIESTSHDGKMHCRWDIFADFSRMTVLRMRPPYWFLYEGTPGGKLDMESDLCVRPAGQGYVETRVSEKWEGDIPAMDGIEWLYFADAGVRRSLYVVHHEDDSAIDSYWPMNEEMTVFGFGRLGLKKFMERIPAHFTVGLCDRVEPDRVRAVINNACQPLSISVGPVEEVTDE